MADYALAHQLWEDEQEREALLETLQLRILQSPFQSAPGL